MADLIRALQNNWQGYEVLQAIAKNKAPQYGRDDDRSDAMARKVMDLWCEAAWPSIIRDPEHRDKFKAFLRGCCENGGTCLQVNMLGAITLKAYLPNLRFIGSEIAVLPARPVWKRVRKKPCHSAGRETASIVSAARNAVFARKSIRLGALELLGKQWTLQDLTAEVLKDKAYPVSIPLSFTGADRPGWKKNADERRSLLMKASFNEQEMKAFEPAEKIGLVACVNPEGLPHISLVTSIMAPQPARLTLGQ